MAEQPAADAPDPPQTPETVVAANVRRLREGTGLTQKELAARAEIGEMVVCTIENGKRRINVDDLYILAHALDVTTRQLLAPGGAEAYMQQYEVTFDGGITEQVAADNVEWDGIWVRFCLLGEPVFVASTPRILGVRINRETL